MDNIIDLKQEVERCEAIASLKTSKGWKYLQEHFTEVKTAILKGLAVELDMNNIIRLQEKYKAFSAMLETVKGMGELAEHLKQQLLDEAQNVQYRSDYALGN